MRPHTLDHSYDRGLDGNMAFLQAIFFVISILCVFSIGEGVLANEIEVLGGDRLSLQCGPLENVEITDVEFKKAKQFNEKDHSQIIKAFDELLKKKDDLANAIKKLCQRKRNCNETPVFNFGGKKKDNIKIKITYKCITTGCPHPMFLNKHTVRCDPSKSEAECIEYVEDDFETKRAQLGGKTTTQLGVFFDPPEYMEYEKESTLCKFKTGASKLDCNKLNNRWKCTKEKGKYIATHDISPSGKGHYRHDLDKKIA